MTLPEHGDIPLEYFLEGVSGGLGKLRVYVLHSSLEVRDYHRDGRLLHGA